MFHFHLSKLTCQFYFISFSSRSQDRKRVSLFTEPNEHWRWQYFSAIRPLCNALPAKLSKGSLSIMHPTVVFPAKNHSYISPWCQKSAETLHLDLKGLAWVYSCLNSPALMTPASCLLTTVQPARASFSAEISVSGCSLSLLPIVDLLSSFIHISAQILLNEKELCVTNICSVHTQFSFHAFINLLRLFTDLITVLWPLSTSLVYIGLRLKAFSIWMWPYLPEPEKKMLSSF